MYARTSFEMSTLKSCDDIMGEVSIMGNHPFSFNSLLVRLS